MEAIVMAIPTVAGLIALVNLMALIVLGAVVASAGGKD